MCTMGYGKVRSLLFYQVCTYTWYNKHLYLAMIRTRYLVYTRSHGISTYVPNTKYDSYLILPDINTGNTLLLLYC